MAHPESPDPQAGLAPSPGWGSLPLESAPIGIALSQGGRYLQVNAAYVRLFGADRPEELLGNSLMENIAESQRDMVRARNQGREQGGQGLLEYETLGRRLDGSTFPMKVHPTTVPLEGGLGTLAFITDLTEQRHIQEQLLGSEATFQSYVEQSIDVIFVLDAGGTFIFASPAWERHFGFPVSTILGQPFAPFVHPEDVAPCITYLGRILTTGQSETSPPYRVRHADGSWRWFVANGTRVCAPDGSPQFMGVAHDITETRRAEEAFRENEEKLRVIFEASKAGIILVSERGVITFANQCMADLFGLPLEAVIGTTYPDHLDPSEKVTGDQRMRMIITGEISFVSVERRFLRGDGTTFWGHLSGRRMENPDGSLRALVGIITDVTKRREAEEQQRILEAQLHQAQKMESLGSLAGGLAHDMNNVLGAILGLASAHQEDLPMESPARGAFGTIIQAAERGGNLLKSLLSFARQNVAEEQALDLNILLQEEVHLLEHTTLAQVRLVLDFSPDLRGVMGDAGALTHAFMNLCVNAVDAMPEGGTLTLRTRNLNPDWVEVQVQDTGMGMASDILDKALDPFFTTKEVGKGTGLGLSIVYRTVKNHQGEMQLHSEPGLGTCVTLRFPAQDLPTDTLEGSGPHTTVASRGRLQVLLVDDDDLVQSSIRSMLGFLGHQTTSALCGEEALAPVASYRVLVLAYAAVGLLLALLFAWLSPRIEAPPAAPQAGRWGLHASKGVVLRLSALFSLDAFAGGFVIQSLVAYWFHKRFGTSPGQLGTIFFAANLLAGLSALYAVKLSKRIGLIHTMVYTHIPSNLLLILVPLMPSLPMAVAMLLLRFSISQMDVPVRQAYTMAVVAPDERSAAAGVTGIARTTGAAISPMLAAPLLALPALAGAPFFLAGGLKILYDLLLYRMFKTSDRQGD